MLEADLIKSERGFILSGVALLLILPALLLSSTYLSIVKGGGEAVSLQSTGDRIHYIGMDIEDTVSEMDKYGMKVNNTILNVLERKYELTGAIEVNLHRTDNIVNIEVKDVGKTAEYSTEIDLSKI